MRGAPRPLLAPQLRAPPGCVARLSQGCGTLCVTGRVPAPLCLRFCLSGRASVILSVPVAWLSLFFCVCPVHFSGVRALSVCLSVITSSVCTLSRRAVWPAHSRALSLEALDPSPPAQDGKGMGVGWEEAPLSHASLERGWCRLSLTTCAKLWIWEDPEIEGRCVYPPGRQCWGPGRWPALFWGSNQHRGGDSAIPGGRPLLSLSQPPFLSFLPSLNLRFFQTAPSPSSPTQRGAERGSGWLLKEGLGLTSFVPDLCAC